MPDLRRLVPVLLRSPIAFALMPVSAAQAQDPQTAPVPQTPTTPQTPAPPDNDPAPPEEEERPRRLLFGPELGVFFLTDSKARDAFGSTFFNYGVGLGGVPQARGRGDFVFDASIITGRRSGGRVLLAPLGLAYRVALSNTTSNVRPYAGVSANLIITDLRSDKYNVGGGVRTTGGGSVFAGLTFGERAYLQARYYGIAKVRGFNLSGLNVSTGFRF